MSGGERQRERAEAVRGPHERHVQGLEGGVGVLHVDRQKTVSSIAAGGQLRQPRLGARHQTGGVALGVDHVQPPADGAGVAADVGHGLGQHPALLLRGDEDQRRAQQQGAGELRQRQQPVHDAVGQLDLLLVLVHLEGDRVVLCAWRPREQGDEASCWCPAGQLSFLGNDPPPPCDIPSGCCFFTGPWTVTRSSLRMLRRVAAFCRPLRPVLLLVSFPRSRGPVVGVPGLCWMWQDVPFARQRRPPPPPYDGPGSG